MRRSVVCGVVGLMALTQAGLAQPSRDLYAVSVHGELMRLDVDSGTYEMIGDTGITYVGGLGFTGGALFAYSLPDASGGVPTLYRVCHKTAKSSPVGALGLDYVYEGGLVFNGDGTAVIMSGIDEPGGDQSARIDISISSGAASSTSEIQAPGIHGVARRGDGVLVAWNHNEPGVFTIDNQSGEHTVLRDYGLLLRPHTIGGMAGVDPATALMLLDRLPRNGLPLAVSLYSVDLYSGELTLVQTFEGGRTLAGLAIGVGCPGDMNNDGRLNFFDVQRFITGFVNEDPAADFNLDNSFNFIDVAAFMQAFSRGCR